MALGDDAGTRGDAHGCWRISSFNRLNLETAFERGVWGARRAVAIRRIRSGDRLVFYCSAQLAGPASNGYWGSGIVTQEPYVSTDQVWVDDLYPHRIGFRPDRALLKTPVRPTELKEALSGAPLRYLRQAGVIRLSPLECEAVMRLLAAAAAKGR